MVLDRRALAVLDAFDGSPLPPLADALADIEARDRSEALIELQHLAVMFARVGLLDDGTHHPRPNVTALGRPVTVCDRDWWRLDASTITDLHLENRLLTVSSTDERLSQVLAGLTGLHSTTRDAIDDTTPLELVVAMSERERGVHALYGRGGRVYARSTDRSALIHQFCLYLASLAWLATDPDVVWLDSLLLHRDGEAALLHGRARHMWTQFGRRLEQRGWRALPSVLAALDPATAQVVVPPMPTGVVAEAMDLLDITSTPEVAFGSRLTVTRIDDLAPDYEVSFLINAGHDLSDLSPPLTGWRVALMAFRGAADAWPSQDSPDTHRGETALRTAAALAERPDLPAALHLSDDALVASLT